MSGAGTSRQAPLAPLPSQLVRACIEYDEDISNISWPPTSSRYNLLLITGLPSYEEASKFITSLEFRLAISSVLETLIAIRLLIDGNKENLKSEHVEKPNKFEFGEQMRVVVSFELVQSGRKIIHWKNDLESPFLSLHLNDDRFSKALAHFVLEFILNAFHSSCTGES
jgi:hypothetical protein